MPDIVKDKLLKAFADVGKKILWKWETESMEGKPDNVLLKKWLPQQDVLGKGFVKKFAPNCPTVHQF